MRRPIILAAGLLAASTGGYALSQQKSFKPSQDLSEGRKDPSFPQPGVMDPPPKSAFEGGEIGIGAPVGSDHGDGSGDGRQGSVVVTLADRLTIEKRAGLWWDYARDVVSVASRLANPERTTLLVPVNEAMIRMDRKPHQNADGSSASDDQAQNNVDRFIAAHIIPADVDLPTQKALATLLKGLSLEIVKDGEEWIVKPGDVKVTDIKEASNGRILLLDGSIPYPSQ